MVGKAVMLEGTIPPQNRPINPTTIESSVRVKTMATTAANKNRAIRQEALRATI